MRMSGGKRKIFIISVTLALILAVCLGFTALISAKPQQAAVKDDLYNQVELFAGTISLIRNNYVDNVSSKDLIYGALKGMLGSLDSHSQFMDPEEYKEMEVETKGRFGGLGVEITLKDGVPTVISAIEDTPAFKAGLKTNDRIVKIDGKSTKDLSLMDAVKLMRGEPGTSVTIIVLREDEKKFLEFKIERGIIQVKSIKEARILEDKIGYIKLVEFQENTSKDLAKALQELKVKGMDSLLLDLRNNPGGLLEVSVKVSEMFLPEGKVIVSTKGRIKDEDKVYKSHAKNLYTDMPMMLLVNEGSASASEIVAGALKDNKRAIVVGAKTFGKGSVQTVIPLGDGSAVRLTTAKYLTPNGLQINNIGIVPDVLISISRETKEAKAPNNGEDDDDLAEPPEKDLHEKDQKGKIAGTEKKKYDDQLQRAIDLIKGIKAYNALKTTA